MHAAELETRLCGVNLWLFDHGNTLTKRRFEMYTNKSYRLVIIAVILMIVMSLLVTNVAQAGNDKPPKDKPEKVTVPHQNPKQDGKPMNVSCHSRHARDAGEGCEKEKPAQPQPATSTYVAEDYDAKVHSVPTTTSTQVMIVGCGGGSRTHVMM